jgi:glycosyltransferase involved in cell wall biosynthesis
VSKKSVLFISYDGLSDPLGQSQILPYLIGLSDEFEINILSCEKAERLGPLREHIQNTLRGAGIEWRYTLYRTKPTFLASYLNQSGLRAKARVWNRHKMFNIIHCRSILAYLIGSKLKSPNNKVIFDFRGYWAEERVDGGLWEKTNIIYYQIYHYFKKAQEKAYKKADAIVSLTKSAKDEIAKTYTIPKSKITVVPCSADQNHFIPKSELVLSTIDLRSDLKIEPSDLVIGYAGSLGTRYMLNEMLDCFKVIVDKHPDAVFLIITVSPLDELKRLISEKGIESKVIVSSSTYKRIPQYMSLMDIALYFIKPGNSGKAVSPTKQAEFLSMGIPIITNDGIGDSKEIIQGNNVGMVIDEASAEQYDRVANSIERLRAIPAEEIIKIAKKKLSLSSGVKSYRSLYQSL